MRLFLAAFRYHRPGYQRTGSVPRRPAFWNISGDDRKELRALAAEASQGGATGTWIEVKPSAGVELLGPSLSRLVPVTFGLRISKIFYPLVASSSLVPPYQIYKGLGVQPVPVVSRLKDLSVTTVRD